MNPARAAVRETALRTFKDATPSTIPRRVPTQRVESRESSLSQGSSSSRLELLGNQARLSQDIPQSSPNNSAGATEHTRLPGAKPFVPPPRSWTRSESFGSPSSRKDDSREHSAPRRGNDRGRLMPYSQNAVQRPISLNQNSTVAEQYRQRPPHESPPSISDFLPKALSQQSSSLRPQQQMQPRESQSANPSSTTPRAAYIPYTPKARRPVIDLQKQPRRAIDRQPRRPNTFGPMEDEVGFEASIGLVELPQEDVNVQTTAPSIRKESDRLVRKRGKGVGSLLDRLAQASEAQVEESIVLRPKRLRKVKLLDVRVQKDVFIPSVISVANLSRLLNIRQERLKRGMIQMGMSEVSYDYMLSSDDASLIALEFGRNPVIDDEAAFDLYPTVLSEEERSSLPLRPPVVTIMGHVDHGKTTLLDTLRSTSVASGEAGGITQHIGAFNVSVPSLSTSSSSEISVTPEGIPRTITFLDTPGHAAFTAMRARGAGVTDIIVLVVAADDGVMPQTKEVIELAKKDDLDGGVGIVVAINKCDKPGVDTTKVKQELLAAGVQLEEYGGDVPAVEVSGLTGFGLDKLMETISTLAEVKELKARTTGKAEGYVLESRVDKGKGPVATVLVLQGSLTQGSTLIAGTTWARVRQMTDSSSQIVRAATPGIPVTVCGWKELPAAGDEVLAGDEADVKRAVENRLKKLEREELKVDVESINEKRREARVVEEKGKNEDGSTKNDEVKELRLIIKADVSGSVEAVVGALEGIGNKLARVKVVQTGVGEVTDSDLNMAKATDATIVGFSVKAPPKLLQTASSLNVPVLTESVIYRLMEEVKSRVTSLLPPIIETRVLGEAGIQELFEIKGKGRGIIKVAGCRVFNGVVEKKRRVKVLREGEILYDGTIEAMKHVKKDVLEARKGTDCGLSFDGFQAFKKDDVVQAYETIEKPPTL